MKGVASYLKDIEDGSIQLVFDDVESVSDKGWKHIAPFTSNNFNADDLKDLKLSKEQFSQIGENLVIRLLALNGYIK